MTHLNRVTDVLSRTRFLIDDEKRLQASIADALTSAGLSFEREVRLSPRDVIDYVSDRVGIEAKVKGSKRAILRQVQRYAGSDRLDAIVVITAVALGLPDQINGKPVRMVSIGRAWL
jgi:hypothetical protein